MTKASAILVAEDDPRDTFLLKRAFSQSRISVPVIFVSDGKAVIDYLSGEPPFNHRDAYPLPALIMLDFIMPRMDGFKVLEWVRGHATFNRTPVLVFSGLNRPTDIIRAYALGAKLFLIKNFNICQWSALLNQVGEIYGLAKPISGEAPRPAEQPLPESQAGHQSTFASAEDTSTD